MEVNRNRILYLSCRKFQHSLLSFLLLFFLSSILLTALSAEVRPKSPWRNFSEAGKFITAIAWDKDNNLWVAGEEFGVSLIPASPYHQAHQGGPARQSSSGEDERTIKIFDIPYCYTIVCDNSGRVWIGSLRQGLYCYQYDEWTNFNTSNGLPSNSVYALAVDKYNTLYCASGLSLAKFSKGKWGIIPLPDTLPKSEISCMDFDRDNNLWVGFFLGGVAKFNGWDWKVYTQKDGLADERVNDILIAEDGAVWVATCNRISRLQPKTGHRWSFINEGLSAYIDESARADYPMNYFLKIAQDNSGNIFFTNRHYTIRRWNNRDFCFMPFTSREQLSFNSFLYCITVDKNGYIWAGDYGRGIITNNRTFKFPKEAQKLKIELEERTPTGDFSKQPEQPALPSLASLRSGSHQGGEKLINKTYKLLKNSLRGEQAYYIGEDWLTQGNWIGNYGEYAWILCGYHHYYEPEEVASDLLGGSDRLGLEGFKHLAYHPYIGENANPDDILRGYITLEWELTDDPRVLHDPLGGGRRYTEWDDHAESYPHPLMREGPHIYLDLDILEEGIFIVSFYFMNKDGHKDWNRFRDYTISIKKRTTSEKEFKESPLLASCRVHDFRAGVYKRFMLKGPGKYTIKFDKKESLNTNLSGVFIDRVEEPE